MALLKAELAAKTYNEDGSCQKNNGRVRASRAKHPNHRPNYGEKCIFCHKGNHSPTHCRTVNSRSMRRKVLREQHRCWKCFSSNHNSFVCRKQNCTSCGQKHDASLCFKKGAPLVSYNEEQRMAIASITPNKQHPRDCRNRDHRANNNQSNRTKPAPVAVQMCAGAVPESDLCPLRPINKQVVIMTAEGSIWNAARQRFEKVLFCFDSGAPKTVIDEQLAEQFGLPKEGTKMSITSGSGGHMEKFESHTVSLKIGTVFGESLELTVETRPIVTNGFPSVKLVQADVAFLKASDIYLANTKVRGEHQIPRILVGLNYYHDLITGHLAKTPSGLHIAKTLFGPAIYGTGFTEVRQANSVSYNLTTICEKTECQALQENSELDGPSGSRRGENPRYSGEIVHAYGFTTVPFPLKENVTEHNCFRAQLLSSRKKATISTSPPACLQLQPPPSCTPRQAASYAIQPPFAFNSCHPSSPFTSSSCVSRPPTSRSRSSPQQDDREES